MRTVAGRTRAWSGLAPAARAAILEEVGRDLARVAADWVATSLAAKGLGRGGMAEAEEWLFVATVGRAVGSLARSMREVAAHGRVHLPGPPRPLAGGGVALRVFPAGRLDGLVYRGMTGEVWTQPDGPTGSGREGGVAAVLGAGNASMLPAVDVLHQLFVERRTVVLKPSPVNAYLGPLIEDAFAALVREGVLRLVHGGAAEGDALCRHPGVDAVHLTGSHRTYEAIAGPAPGRPALDKPVTSELGNVSPVIVVPGPWGARDVERQARRIATWLVAGGGFGCLTPQVLVQHAGWPGRAALLEALRRTLARVPTRPAYYPGAAERFKAFTAAHARTWTSGEAPGTHLPWAVVGDVDAAAADDICFREEAFCGLIAETALPATDAAEFLDRAVDFANTVLWGTLNATLLVHPASARRPSVAGAVERAVAALRYGTVTVNSAAFAAYHLQVLPWGAYPPRDGLVESGSGQTANGLLLPEVVKSVLRGPFADRPDPLTVAAHRPESFARRLAAHATAPSALALPGLAASAVRGGLAPSWSRR